MVESRPRTHEASLPLRLRSRPVCRRMFDTAGHRTVGIRGCRSASGGRRDSVRRGRGRRPCRLLITRPAARQDLCSLRERPQSARAQDRQWRHDWGDALGKRRGRTLQRAGAGAGPVLCTLAPGDRAARAGVSVAATRDSGRPEPTVRAAPRHRNSAGGAATVDWAAPGRDQHGGAAAAFERREHRVERPAARHDP